MKKIRTTLTTGAASLGLVVGVATFAGASSGTIGTTGPYSNNEVEHTASSTVKMHNKNDVKAHNDNDQHAYSGDAEATGNTTAGDAETGKAMNANSLNASLSVDNSASGVAAMPMPALSANHSGTINTTGPNSNNQVTTTTTSEVEVHNYNDLYVHNDNDQHASSGDATVSGNTTGGSAMTGDATNTNSTTINFSVKN